ncbi:SAM-dependent methyltransferase [Frankia umida]|uniref:SAM-dependent methyltransferase n=1 Tax=Frankia umida TaxID=573489 RepID=UPI0027E3D700|nr:SAM-dependent methyltransferase [Frankia umida]
MLGGKENVLADREAAERSLAGFPHIRTSARQNQAFRTRAVRHLATDAEIRQFLDIGTGIPTSPNLREVAQGIALEARVVHTDNDPTALVPLSGF